MFAFLISPVGRDLTIFVIILGMLAGAYAYYNWSKNQIATLTANIAKVQQQSDDLATAKAALEADIASNKAAQDAANAAITAAQNTADQAKRAIQAAQTQLKSQAKTNPRALEKQINADQAAQYKALEALTQ